MACEGVVKSFNGAKGYGFITQDEGDVFVHERECGGAAPAVGDNVTFDTAESPSKPGTFVAKNVTGCTGVSENAKGGGKGGGKVQGTGQFTGSVKSFSDLKGFGFILHGDGEADVFFHQKDVVDGSVCDRGDSVRYDVEDNPGKPGTLKAKNVTGGSKGKGGGKGKDAYGAAPAWGADPWSMGPYGGGGAWGKGGGWGGDPWAGKGGNPWGCGGKGGDPWGMGGKGCAKGGWW